MTVAKAEQLDDRAEDHRTRMGLSFNQWKRLKELGYETKAIALAYTNWQRHIVRVLEWEERNAEFSAEGTPYLSAVQASRALGIGEFHVCNLRQRGKLEGVKLNRNVVYSPKELLRLVSQDYRNTDTKRSPLSKSFIRWLELKQAA